MSDIHAVIRRLKSKDDVKKQLSLFFEIASCDAYRFAAENCALNACTFAGLFPGMRDGLQDAIPEFRTLLNDFSAFYCSFVSDPSGDRLGEALELRKRNTALMEGIQEISDTYRLAEYIVNRVEHRFSGKGLPERYSDQEYADGLVRTIAGKHEEGQNLLLSLIIPELPVRMTRMRFLDFASARLSAYKGGEKEAFVNLLHSLRTASGLEIPDSDMPLFREVREVFAGLKELDYKTLTAETLNPFKESLSVLSDSILRASEAGNTLQEVLNGLTALQYLRSCPDDTEPEALGILKTLKDAFPEEGENLSAVSATEEMLPLLEGRIESSQAEYTESSASAQQFLRMYDFDYYEVRPASDAFLKAGKLLGNSLYADPEEETGSYGEKLENDEYERLAEELVRDFAASTAGVPKLYYRAAASGFLRILPPFFSTQETLENYIFDALSRCTDPAEKAGCIEIIGEITKDLHS